MTLKRKKIKGDASYCVPEMDYPDFYKIKINYAGKKIQNLKASINEKLEPVFAESNIIPGDTVAVCIGSRGISGISKIVKAVCDKLVKYGAKPYIVPAMGSHGGANGEGQEKVLEYLGVDELYCGVRVVSSMDTEIIGHVLDDVPVHFSKDCLDMKHSICVNRIKPHTKFKGPIESGIYKMLCIGMGKHQGAISCHNAALRHGFSPVIKEAGDLIREKTNFRFGIAVVEDQYEDIMEISVLPSFDLFKQESELLKLAKKYFPLLPFKTLDALIIHEIGKEISGSGMDPNVTGRAYDYMEDDFSGNLDVKRIAILNLSEKTDGNGIGLGNADIITEKVYEKLDYQKTLINALTSVSLRKAFIPVKLPDDRSAIRTAFTTTGIKDLNRIRAVIIRNTRDISEFWVSSSLIDEIIKNPQVEILEKKEIAFDGSGNIENLFGNVEE